MILKTGATKMPKRKKIRVQMKAVISHFYLLQAGILSRLTSYHYHEKLFDGFRSIWTGLDILHLSSHSKRRQFIMHEKCKYSMAKYFISYLINNPKKFNVGIDDLGAKPCIPHKSLLQ